jgi:hypothetical protein
MYMSKHPFNRGLQAHTVHKQPDKYVTYNHKTDPEAGCLTLEAGCLTLGVGKFYCICCIQWTLDLPTPHPTFFGIHRSPS